MKDGKSAIYHYNLITGTLEPLTAHRSIDTSTFVLHPMANKLFLSDRDREGGRTTFIMDIKGEMFESVGVKGNILNLYGHQEAIILVFTKQHKGRFYIGLMSPEGTSERLIAQGYLVEAPSWSPKWTIPCFYKRR